MFYDEYIRMNKNYNLLIVFRNVFPQQLHSFIRELQNADIDIALISKGNDKRFMFWMYYIKNLSNSKFLEYKIKQQFDHNCYYILIENEDLDYSMTDFINFLFGKPQCLI